MVRPLVVLFPGLALPPSRYESLLEVLAKELRATTMGYVPAGIQSRIDETGPTLPDGMAAELLSTLPAGQSPRVPIGHSAGAHAARAAAALDPGARAVALIDPNLGDAGRYDPEDFDVPAVMSGWNELYAVYAEAGIPREHVLREWWHERPDGTLERAFNLEVIRSQMAAYPHGAAILEEIRALSESLSVGIVRTTAGSVNADAAWEKLSALAPTVEILTVQAHHSLPPEEQRIVATRIAEWLGGL
jgi:pimeloyl-ACP methyl ester carboxylesterase